MHKGFLAITMLVVVGLALPLTAQAVCSQIGEVVRVTDTATTSTAFLRTSALSSVVWFGSTLDPDLRNALRSCENSRHRCQLIGNAAACPAAGALRFMGTITTVVANP
jgi:hypothetical protein